MDDLSFKLGSFVLYSKNLQNGSIDFLEQIKVENVYDNANKVFKQLPTYDENILKSMKTNIANVLRELKKKYKDTPNNIISKENISHSDLINFVKLSTFLTKLFSRLYVLITVHETIIAQFDRKQIDELKEKIFSVTDLLFTLDKIPNSLPYKPTEPNPTEMFPKKIQSNTNSVNGVNSANSATTVSVNSVISE
jgi:hypothetical protein